MKQFKVLIILSVVLGLISSNALATGGHGAGGSSVDKSGKSACKKTQIKQIRPEHLATVAPGSEIYFRVEGIDDAKYVDMTAKKIPVKLSSEYKGGVMRFTGNLPDSLVNTAARIHVVVHYKKCPAEKGWLLKITE